MHKWTYLVYLFLLGFSWLGASSIQYGLIGEQKLHRDFQEHIHSKQEGANKIGYLVFESKYPISESTYLYVKYALKYFKQQEVAFVIAHFKSFGGELIPTIKIVDLLQKFDVNEGIPLLAFIDSQALASSTMIVYACRFIAVSQNGVMGGSFETAHHTWHVPQNFLPYLLNEYASLANLYGRNPLLAEAMVDPAIIVAEKNQELITVTSMKNVEDQAQLLSSDSNLLTLTADQMLKYGIADFVVMNSEEFSPSKHVLSWPFYDSPLSKESYLGAIPQATVITYHHWIISFLVFLTYPFVGAFCIVGIIVSFYLQIKSRKFNRYGALGFCFLGFLILASFALQALSVVDMIFLGLGVTLIVLDSARKVSGGGIVGFLGIGFTIISLIMLMLPGFEKFTLLDFETSAFVARSLIGRVLWVVGALIVSWIAIILLKKHYIRDHHPLPKEAVMITEAPKGMGFLEKFEETSLPKEGSEGMAHCSLRPLGKVVINDKIYEAVSHDGKTIIKKTHVVVVKHFNGKLVVKATIDT